MNNFKAIRVKFILCTAINPRFSVQDLPGFKNLAGLFKSANYDGVKYSHTQHIHATADKIFPLLCPTREYEWIPMWECSLLYSESGDAEEGCVFTTNRPEDGDKDVWVISRHAPNKHIQFSLRTIKYDITLRDNNDGTTSVDWEQQITGLNEDGNRFISKMKENDFIKMVSMLEKFANHYFETGTMFEQF